MIKPDRLKELIEQKATIYNKNKGSIKLDKNCYIDNNNVLCFYKIGIGYLGFDFIRNLFETEEEAEWYLEFGNITREEKLSLPSWEEFMSNSNGIEFIAKNGDKIRFHKISDFTDSTITLYDKNGKAPIDEEWEATKENYIDACRLCKKLFLGEKV